MKKLILSLFVVAAFSATSFAQLSLKAGVNLADQSFESSGFSADTKSKVGFLIGANYAVNLSESIALRPGIQFTLKGSKVDFGNDEGTLSFNYIEVPVDLVYKISDFSIHAGPYLGLLMSAKADDEDVKDDVTSTDFGLNFGLGYSIGKIGVGANYGLGLSNLNNDDTDDTNVKNKVISVYVTYTL